MEISADGTLSAIFMLFPKICNIPRVPMIC